MNVGADVHQLKRSVDDITDFLVGAQMKYQDAVSAAEELRGIKVTADRIQTEAENSNRILMEIIEGLMSNWPHTEIVDYFRASNPGTAVLQKEIALKAAAQMLQHGYLLQPLNRI